MEENTTDFCHGFDCKVKTNCKKYISGKGLGIYFPKYIDDADGCKFYDPITKKSQSKYVMTGEQMSRIYNSDDPEVHWSIMDEIRDMNTIR